MTVQATKTRTIGSTRIYVIADAIDADGGHLIERLEQLGAEIVYLDRDELPTYDSTLDSALIVLLGSRRSAHDPKWGDVVEAESAFVRSALDDLTPVMGICYGAQLMARALGGTSGRAAAGEIGWQHVETLDPLLCPEGPWAQFHSDVFVPPPTSQILGTSSLGPQCFVDDSLGARAIAWQFHPEVTASTYERWVNELYEGGSQVDPIILIDQAYENESPSRTAAHRLTDSALAYLGIRVAGAERQDDD